jgi:hypothetical protein
MTAERIEESDILAVKPRPRKQSARDKDGRVTE